MANFLMCLMSTVPYFISGYEAMPSEDIDELRERCLRFGGDTFNKPFLFPVSQKMKKYENILWNIVKI